VSLSWRNRFEVELAPAQVTLRLTPRGLRPAPAAPRQATCAAAAPGTASWRPALQALESQLAALDTKGGDVHVVLSNHFVRYTLVPFNAELPRPADDQALARHQFTRDYGPVARDWTLQVSDNGRSCGPRLACALDSALLVALRDLCKTHKLTLLSVQPALMSAFNRCNTQLDPNGGFIHLEPGRLCIARFRDGQWASIVNRRTGPDWLQEYNLLRQRERVLDGSEDNTTAPLRVWAPDFPALDAEQTRRHPELVWLAAKETAIAAQPVSTQEG
jgi:hypothetical protein